MRSTRATRAVCALWREQPQAVLSEAQVEQALRVQGVVVNRVTVYRLLGRFAEAGMLHRSVDTERTVRYALASPADQGAMARFECADCHSHFQFAQSAGPLQAALEQLQLALAGSGYRGQAVDVAVRGQCAGCAVAAG